MQKICGKFLSLEVQFYLQHSSADVSEPPFGNVMYI